MQLYVACQNVLIFQCFYIFLLYQDADLYMTMHPQNRAWTWGGGHGPKFQTSLITKLRRSVYKLDESQILILLRKLYTKSQH